MIAIRLRRLELIELESRGGKGSGDFGHSGRPGSVGGSGSGGGAGGGGGGSGVVLGKGSKVVGGSTATGSGHIGTINEATTSGKIAAIKAFLNIGKTGSYKVQDLTHVKSVVDSLKSESKVTVLDVAKQAGITVLSKSKSGAIEEMKSALDNHFLLWSQDDFTLGPTHGH